MLDPKTGPTKQHSTSPALTRSTPTLPYYNEYKDGKIWFNEHEGNAVASYDLERNTLVEHYIPTRNHNWGNTLNPLQFEIDKNGSIWFMEWTENKLGVIPKGRINQLPILCPQLTTLWLLIAKQVNVIILMCMCIEITTLLLLITI